MDFLYEIDNILREEECQYYMSLFDNKDMVEDIDDKHRKYHRIQIVNQEFANRLYEKVKEYLGRDIMAALKTLVVPLLYGLVRTTPWPLTLSFMLHWGLAGCVLIWASFNLKCCWFQ